MRRTVLSVIGIALLVAPALAAAHGPWQRDRVQTVSRAGIVNGQWIDTVISIDRGGVVDLDLGAGEVVVTGWARNDVRLRAVSQTGNVSLRVTSVLATLRAVPGSRGRRGEVRYEVSVPSHVRVLVRTSAADIIAKGVGGDFEVRTGSGDVQVSDNGGLVVAELMSGDFVGTRLSGGARIEAIAANVEIVGAAGEITIDNTAGSTTLSGVTSSSVAVESVSGDIRFDGSIERGGRYRFTSHSGAVTLGVPQGAGAVVSLATHNGTVDTRLPITLEPTPRGSPEKRLLGRIGDGTARIEVVTFSGNIDIRGVGREWED